MSQTALRSCLLTLAVTSLSSWACSFDDKGLTTESGGVKGGGTGLDGSVSVRDGGNMTGNLDAGGLTEDANCGLVKSPLMNAPADLLILLDRSGSMLEDSAGMSCQGGCGANSKWTQMTTAINQAVSQTETKVNWGLKFFGSSSGCTVNNRTEVPPAPMNSAAIAAAIAGNTPNSSTPTRAGVTAAGTYMTGLNDGNPKYIILATDGLPNCPASGNTSTPDDAAAIAAVGMVAGAGVPVFVIGIATNTTADATLNGMAMAGGKPAAGAQQYYPVSNTADLVSVLNTLQGMVARGCTYRLPMVPPNPGNVKVTVGGVKVDRDTTHTTGWDYSPDMLSIIFYGGLCDQLKAGSAGEVAIILGCGIAPIP